MSHVKQDITKRGRVFEVAGREVELVDVPGGTEVSVWVRAADGVMVNVGRVTVRKAA